MGDEGLGYYKEQPLTVQIVEELFPDHKDPIAVALDELFCWEPQHPEGQESFLHREFAIAMDFFHRSSLMYAHTALW